MAEEFTLEVITPSKQLLKSRVTEVVLPGYDGEVGILAGHEGFVGLLGTGVLKLVRDGDDYWFMVSSGLYEVAEGTLRVFAEVAEDARDIDPESAAKRTKELEVSFQDPAKFRPELYEGAKLEHDQNAARVEVHRRTHMVN